MTTRMIYPALALLAVAGLLWGALAAAPAVAVDLGSPGDSRFIGGFYDAETGEGASFRWSGLEARLALHGAPPGAALLALRLSGERLVAQGAPRVALARGETTFAAFAASPGWRVYRVLLPPGAVAAPSGEALPISLRTTVSTPGAGDAGRDYRALGAPVDWVGLAPVAGAPTAALPRALWLAWAVALAGAGVALGLARWSGRPRAERNGQPERVGGRATSGEGRGGHPAAGDGRGGRATTGARGQRAAVGLAEPHLAASAAILALGLALAAWAWRAPQTLAWALPPTPWALGAATALLAAVGLGVRHKAPAQRGELTQAAGLVTPAQRGERTQAAGLAALGVGVALMHSQLAVGAGVSLAAAGLAALMAAPGGLGAQVWAPPATPAAGRLPLVALGGIFLLALGLRLFRLDELPFGLWRDEARHGLVALRIAEDPTYRPAYVLDLKVHLPGLGLYPFAVALELLGVHLWTLRAATALAGALTVLPLYGVASRLSGRPAVGLGAALLLAASSWHISISRLAFPTVFEPLLSLSAWWLLLWALGLRRALLPTAGAGLLAGALLGAAAQTYHTGRVTPLAALLLCLLLLGRDRGAWRLWLVGVGAAALGFALAVAPLAAYALARPGDFNDRVGEVFLLGEAALRGRAPLSALDANLGRHLLMFSAAGDANGRHHAPLRPLLDIVTGMGLLLGLAGLLRTLGDWRSRFLLGAVAVGLLPGLLAVDAPHAMRTFGAVAPAYVIASLGWAGAWGLVSAHRQHRQARWPALAGGAAVIGLNAWLYFGVMPGDPQVFQSFYPVQSQMGVYVREHGGGATFYVPAGVREHPSFAFLASGLPVEAFDPATGQAAPRPVPGAPFLLSGYFAEQEAAALADVLGPGARPASVGPAFPDGRGPTFYLYRAR